MLASPLALGHLDDGGGRDWRRLSEIGQTYGAVSALLAVIALGGVAASLVLQARTVQLERAQAYRSTHIGLIGVAMENPELLDCFAFRAATSNVDRRQHVYCNQVYLALQMGYTVGAISDESLRMAAREVLEAPVGRRWWGATRQYRSAPRDRRGLHVLDVMDEQWNALTSSDEGRAGEQVPPRP